MCHFDGQKKANFLNFVSWETVKLFDLFERHLFMFSTFCTKYGAYQIPRYLKQEFEKDFQSADE